jgi:histidyl-tRNA synthetase
LSERLQAPRGTYDVLPEDAAARAAVEDVVRGVLEPAGFARVETPAFEHTELFSRGVGASTDIVQKEMFTFDDRGGRSLTLRPEGTAGVVRAYLEHGMARQPQPVKVWYLGPFFRNERPQAGRFKQFWQVGAEAIGSSDPAVDAELIVLLQTVLEQLEVAGVQLRVNSLGTPESRAEYREALTAHLRANEDRLSEEVRSRIDLNPLRAFDADHPGTREVMATAPLLRDFLSGEDAEHFAEVRALLEAAGVAYEVDPTLVRGLDYYARTIFELTSSSLGAQSAVGGGGRYDGLAQQLGAKEPVPGCGWAAGVERMLLAATARPPRVAPVDLFVVWEPAARAAAFALVGEARRAGLAARMDLAGRSTKGQFKQANREGARRVAVLHADGAPVLRDMDSGEEEHVDLTAIVPSILKGRFL